MSGFNIETAKINLTTVVSIVIASFSLYFFLSGLIADAIIQSKIYAIDLDMERDRSVVEMYRFQIENNIAAPNAPSRMASLQDKIELRMQEKAVFEAQL